jgi:hypothetical protein
MFGERFGAHSAPYAYFHPFWVRLRLMTTSGCAGALKRELQTDYTSACSCSVSSNSPIDSAITSGR